MKPKGIKKEKIIKQRGWVSLPAFSWMGKWGRVRAHLFVVALSNRHLAAAPMSLQVHWGQTGESWLTPTTNFLMLLTIHIRKWEKMVKEHFLSFIHPLPHSKQGARIWVSHHQLPNLLVGLHPLYTHKKSKTVNWF